MTATVRATAILDAKDQTGPAFAAAQARIKQLERNFERLNAVQNRAARSSTLASSAIARNGSNIADRAGGFSANAALLAGRVGPALAGIGVTAVAAQSVKRFAEVERAMTRVGITGEATNEEIASGITRMRELAQETAQPFDRMREGMEALTSSGKSFQESLAMLPAIARTAQASGASMADTANSSIALLNHLGIKAEELQLAQDIMAKAGKLGQFEAKDMARYFPSMMPAANAAGFQGIEGLKKLSAVVQTIRSGTGTSEEAAGSAMNIFAKMESEETAKKFKKFGVDLRTEMEKARKEGQNIFETFLDLSAKALKGDLSKLPQLFQDMEVQRGMRPLMATREKIKQFVYGMNDAAGTTSADLARILANKQAEIDRFVSAWDRMKTEVGKSLAASIGGQGATGIMERVSDHLSGTGSAAPGQVTKRLEAHVKATADGKLADDEAEAAKIRGKILALRDRVAADPKFAERHDVGARARQYREQLAAITDRIAQARMPKMGEGGNVYDMPGGLIVSREALEAAREFKRFGSGSKFPAVNAPLPPMRPGDLPQTGPMPALDFSAAVDSAKEAKDDIEAALRAIDLASAGAQAGSGFKNSLMGELRQAEPEIKSWADRVKAMLSFTATPKITPGGLPVGKSPAGQERPPASTMDGF